MELEEGHRQDGLRACLGRKTSRTTGSAQQGGEDRVPWAPRAAEGVPPQETSAEESRRGGRAAGSVRESSII